MTGLTFVAPPPGLEPLIDFELHPVEGAPGLFTLHALDRPDRRMFVLDAGVHLPYYRPELSDGQAASIKATDPAEVATFVVATPKPEGGVTVNLLAPIVVNTVTDMCAQVILEGQDYAIRSELLAAV